MDSTSSCDFKLVIRVIDEHLVSFGTQSLIDGDKVRDAFLDLRSIVSIMDTPTPEAVLPSV